MYFYGSAITGERKPLREALFIKKNKDRWLRNQHLPSADPDEMAADFINLVDDLAYAKTFYPMGKVTGYINARAARIYLDIYKNRREESNRIVRFWKTDLPLTINRHHRVVQKWCSESRTPAAGWDDWPAGNSFRSGPGRGG